MIRGKSKTTEHVWENNSFGLKDGLESEIISFFVKISFFVLLQVYFDK